MTGPEHYREAERLMAEIRNTRAHNDETNPAAALLLAEAQVHATLANAAAIAMSAAGEGGMSYIDFAAWDTVAGLQES